MSSDRLAGTVMENILPRMNKEICVDEGWNSEQTKVTKLGEANVIYFITTLTINIFGKTINTEEIHFFRGFV